MFRAEHLHHSRRHLRVSGGPPGRTRAVDRQETDTTSPHRTHCLGKWLLCPQLTRWIPGRSRKWLERMSPAHGAVSGATRCQGVASSLTRHPSWWAPFCLESNRVNTARGGFSESLDLGAGTKTLLSTPTVPKFQTFSISGSAVSWRLLERWDSRRRG